MVVHGRDIMTDRQSGSRNYDRISEKKYVSSVQQEKWGSQEQKQGGACLPQHRNSRVG